MTLELKINLIMLIRKFRSLLDRPIDKVFQVHNESFRASFTQAKKITHEVKLRNHIEDLLLIKETHATFSTLLMLTSLSRGTEKFKVYTGHDRSSFGLVYDIEIYAETWGKNLVRGFSKKYEADMAEDKGVFSVEKRLPAADSDHSSSRNLEDPNKGLTDHDVQQYFDLSEQVYSKVYISGDNFASKTGDYFALSFVIQKLPGGENDQIDEIYHKILKNSQALHADNLSEIHLEKLFDQEVNISSSEHEFKCNCTKEIVTKHMKSMPIESLISMKQDSYQLVSCSTCSEAYKFSKEEIDSYLDDDIIDLSIKK